MINNRISKYSSNIDFVILWVDPSDNKWQKQREKYDLLSGDKRKNRFRDFENLQYLFRGIEKYAPWVNKIFFITWGHVPSWLNTENEKIRVVRHDEFIPKKYLPTFNSNVIEMNLHNIQELSEKFVLLNDDIFILRKLNKKDFFHDDLPNDMYIEYIKENPSFRHNIMKKNYLQIINKYYDKKDFIKKYKKKIYSIKYGIKGIICNYKNQRKEEFQDFYTDHLSRSFLKSTFSEVWEKENKILDIACFNRFRADNDIGQTLCRYFQLLSGNFYPSKSLGKYFEIQNDTSKIEQVIKSRKYKMICINDVKEEIDFENIKKNINSAFYKIFDEKSKFER